MRRALVVACVAWVAVFVGELIWLLVGTTHDPMEWSQLLTVPLVVLFVGGPIVVVVSVLILPFVLGSTRDDASSGSLRNRVILPALLIGVIALFPIPMKLERVGCEQINMNVPLVALPGYRNFDSGASELWFTYVLVSDTRCFDF